MLSRPLFLLSVAEAFSEQSESSDDSDGNSGSHEYSEINSETSPVNSQLDTRLFKSMRIVLLIFYIGI